MNTQYFNRHKVFTVDDLSLVLSLIRTDFPEDVDDFEIVNQLFGLFDGYFYDEGRLILDTFKDNQSLIELINKIKSNLYK